MWCVQDVFPVIISAIVSAVDKHGMLLRVFQLASLAATIELAIHVFAATPFQCSHRSSGSQVI